jgi:hypothetical protein
MSKVLVHVRCNAAGKVRHEKRDGRDVMVIPSYTLKSGIVMNGVKYEHDEIESTYKGLERTPAPLGHPIINGRFVPALHPEALARNFVFAWNENVRRDGDRIALDKVIDVARANESDSGKALIAAVNKGEPIHTSTGLICNLQPAANGATDHKYLAKNIVWDHDAILLNEDGAATPEQGVGMLVNASGEAEEIEVINSALDEADRDLDWAVDSLARALKKRQEAPMLVRLKAALIDAFTGFGREPSLNTKEDDMTVSKEQFDALSAEVKTLSEGIGNTIATAVANAIKPLTDNLTALQNAQKAKDDEEKATLVNAIVKANLLDEATAKELTLNAARALAEKAKPGKAAPLNGKVVIGNVDDEFAGVDLNAGMEGK